jgi:hypothetical protein
MSYFSTNQQNNTQPSNSISTTSSSSSSASSSTSGQNTPQSTSATTSSSSHRRPNNTNNNGRLNNQQRSQGPTRPPRSLGFQSHDVPPGLPPHQGPNSSGSLASRQPSSSRGRNRTPFSHQDENKPTGGRFGEGNRRYPQRSSYRSQPSQGERPKNFLVDERGQLRCKTPPLPRPTSIRVHHIFDYNGPDLFSLFPSEIHCRIFSFLSEYDLRSLTATSKDLRSLCEEFIWAKHLRRLSSSLLMKWALEGGVLDVGVLFPLDSKHPSNIPPSSLLLSFEKNKWSNMMLYEYVKSSDHAWREGDYHETLIFGNSSGHPELKVAMSAPTSTSGRPLLVTTQGPSLSTLPIDHHSRPTNGNDRKWKTSRASSSLTALRTFNTLRSEQFAVSGSFDGRVSIWDLNSSTSTTSTSSRTSPSPRLISSYKCHSTAIESLDASGDLICSGGNEAVAVLSRLRDGKFVDSFKMESRIWSIRCHTPSSSIAIGIGGGKEDETLHLLDLETRRKKQSFKGLGAVYDLQFDSEDSPFSSACLLSASYDGMVRQWDMRLPETSACVAVLFEDFSDEPPYCFQRHSWKLIVGTRSYSQVRLADFRKTRKSCLRTFYIGEAKSPIYSLCCDGSNLFVTPRGGLYQLNFSGL